MVTSCLLNEVRVRLPVVVHLKSYHWNNKTVDLDHESKIDSTCIAGSDLRA